MINSYTATKFPFFFTGIILISTLLGGCASKRFMNKALELEEAGLISESADLYLRSLQANDDNIDSKLGLKRTGQVVLDKKSDEFMAFYRNSQYKEAVYTFLDAKKYHTQVKRFGIDLNFSKNTHAYYQEVKDIYLNEQYGKAVNALNVENFDNALRLFNEILEIDSNYRNATQLWTTARYEPVYKDGINFLKSGKNRNAYYAFDEILKNNGEYKEASKRQNEAREKALIRIGFIPFTSFSISQQNIADEIRTYITSEISRQNSPFYEVIESPSLKKFNMSYVLLRNLLLNKKENHPELPANMDAVLTGKINDYSSTTSSLTKTKRKAWLKETKTIKKEDGSEEKVTEYRKVYYFEYSRKSQFNVSLSYSLTNTHNNTVMVADVIEKEMEDHIKYAKFDGDHRKLIPGTWHSLTRKSQTDKVYDDSRSIKELQLAFGSRQDLTESYELKKQSLSEISNIISQKIINYNPEI
jgi:tetratricopeptide (TPR) repeat protein